MAVTDTGPVQLELGDIKSVTIVQVEAQQFLLPTELLKYHCPIFQPALKGDRPLIRINLQGLNAKTFTLIDTYIRQGQLPEITIQNAIDLYSAATNLGMRKIVDFSHEEKVVAYELLAKVLGQLIACRGFLELTEDQLLDILESEPVKKRPQDDRIRAIIRWIQGDCRQRAPSAQRLLTRFKRIDATLLSDDVCPALQHHVPVLSQLLSGAGHHRKRLLQTPRDVADGRKPKAHSVYRQGSNRRLRSTVRKLGRAASLSLCADEGGGKKPHSVVFSSDADAVEGGRSAAAKVPSTVTKNNRGAAVTSARSATNLQKNPAKSATTPAAAAAAATVAAVSSSGTASLTDSKMLSRVVDDKLVSAHISIEQLPDMAAEIEHPPPAGGRVPRAPAASKFPALNAAQQQQRQQQQEQAYQQRQKQQQMYNRTREDTGSNVSPTNANEYSGAANARLMKAFEKRQKAGFADQKYGVTRWTNEANEPDDDKSPQTEEFDPLVWPPNAGRHGGADREKASAEHMTALEKLALRTFSKKKPSPKGERKPALSLSNLLALAVLRKKDLKREEDEIHARNQSAFVNEPYPSPEDLREIPHVELADKHRKRPWYMFSRERRRKDGDQRLPKTSIQDKSRKMWRKVKREAMVLAGAGRKAKEADAEPDQ